VITIEIKDLLRQLRSGKLDVASAPSLEQLSPGDLAANLREVYPLVFQERRIRDKYEIGMARSISLETTLRQIPNSLFLHVRSFLTLSKCVFISSYHDSLGEITTISHIQVVPKGGAALDVTLKMGGGYKLDKTPDGWAVRRLKRRTITLTEPFLVKRGWNFDVFGVFAKKFK
jgi:hypothetical protein